MPITLLGEPVDLTYKYNHIGTGAADLEKVLKDGKIIKILKEAKRPAVIVGPGILKRKDRSAILEQVQDDGLQLKHHALPGRVYNQGIIALSVPRTLASRSWARPPEEEGQECHLPAGVRQSWTQNPASCPRLYLQAMHCCMLGIGQSQGKCL